MFTIQSQQWGCQLFRQFYKKILTIECWVFLYKTVLIVDILFVETYSQGRPLKKLYFWTYSRLKHFFSVLNWDTRGRGRVSRPGPVSQFFSTKNIPPNDLHCNWPHIMTYFPPNFPFQLKSISLYQYFDFSNFIPWPAVSWYPQYKAPFCSEGTFDDFLHVFLSFLVQNQY